MTLKDIRIERFEDAPSIPLEAKPMEVYFTSDLLRCDFPGSQNFTDDQTIANTEVDYSYNVMWYKKLYEYLKASYGITYDGRTPTPTQNATLMQLQYIIDQYAKFPDPNKLACKVKVPNWVTFMPQRTDIRTSEKIILGDIEQNSKRGPPNSWAFVGSMSPDVGLLSENGLEFSLDDVKDDYYTVTTYDNQTYVRAAVSEFSQNMIKTLYCNEDENRYDDYVITFGLQINPDTKAVTFIKNNKAVEVNDITDYDIVTFFLPFFRKENVRTTTAGVENLYKVSISRPYKITQLAKNLCGTIRKVFTNIDVVITFEDSAKIKTILVSVEEGKYYSGDTETLAKTKSDVDATLNQLTTDIASKLATYDESNRSLAAKTKEIKGLQKDMRSLYLNKAVWQRVKSRWWFSMWSNNTKDAVRGTVTSLEDQYNKMQESLRMKYLEKVQLTTDVNKAWTDLEKMRGNFNYLKKVRNNLDEYSGYMNDKLLKDIRNMLVNNKLRIDTSLQPAYISKNNVRIELPALYWRHLSHDGNLYVVL